MQDPAVHVVMHAPAVELGPSRAVGRCRSLLGPLIDMIELPSHDSSPHITWLR